MAIAHLEKKAKKKIPLYEENKADRVNVPFLDIFQKKTRYFNYFRRDNKEWVYTGVSDDPQPTRY